MWNILFLNFLYRHKSIQVKFAYGKPQFGPWQNIKSSEHLQVWSLSTAGRGPKRK